MIRIVKLFESQAVNYENSQYLRQEKVEDFRRNGKIGYGNMNVIITYSSEKVLLTGKTATGQWPRVGMVYSDTDGNFTSTIF